MLSQKSKFDLRLTPNLNQLHEVYFSKKVKLYANQARGVFCRC